ncbi:hypothetical protein LZ198_27280 [Myxococcus sp. K15C18031901]|uniref:DUF6624 domain-containing protein n=1 Tax=Myxococcus dinghuensis TaxID=2906761 RepID=UPI0020A6ECBD|nr:DUF6624 domain-containing protein [Myxococcus dinghuensis]MCP3102582.1 hypothetical protein [Myxococcus dinghuensis]
MRRLVVLFTAMSLTACVRTTGGAPVATPAESAAAAREDASEAGFLAWRGEHASALPLFRRAWARGGRGRFMAYDAACSAALLGEDTEALRWLGRAVDEGLDELARLREEPRLARVRGLPGYAVLEQRVAEAEAKALRATDPALRDELIAHAAEHHAVRETVLASNLRGEAARKRLEEVDRRNAAWLAEVVARKGWPDHATVGPRASFAAWLLVQGANHDVAFQARVLPMLEEAVARGEGSAANLAHLTDRVLVNTGKPQRYGTQMEEVDGVMVPKTLEDPAGVDARRAAVGLGTMEEYKAVFERMRQQQAAGQK